VVIDRTTQDTPCAAAAKSSTEGRMHAAVIAGTARLTSCAVAGEWCVGRGSGRAVALRSTTAAEEAAAVGSLSSDGKGVATDEHVECQDGHSSTGS